MKAEGAEQLVDTAEIGGIVFVKPSSDRSENVSEEDTFRHESCSVAQAPVLLFTSLDNSSIPPGMPAAYTVTDGTGRR